MSSAAFDTFSVRWATLQGMIVADLILPFSSPSQNELQKWHWSMRRRFRQQVQIMIRMGLSADGISLSESPQKKRRLEVTRVGHRILDVDNLIGGCKPIVDALKMEFLIQDDSPKWLESEYRQQTVKKFVETPDFKRSRIGDGCTRLLILETDSLK